MTETTGKTIIGPDEALVRAHKDATEAYRDLSSYRIRVALELDGWHVDYEVKEPGRKGGGPHYLLDPATGAILTKRYEQ